MKTNSFWLAAAVFLALLSGNLPLSLIKKSSLRPTFLNRWDLTPMSWYRAGSCLLQAKLQSTRRLKRWSWATSEMRRAWN